MQLQVQRAGERDPTQAWNGQRQGRRRRRLRIVVRPGFAVGCRGRGERGRRSVKAELDIRLRASTRRMQARKNEDVQRMFNDTRMVSVCAWAYSRGNNVRSSVRELFRIWNHTGVKKKDSKDVLLIHLTSPLFIVRDGRSNKKV